jgi:hypothetical protein
LRQLRDKALAYLEHVIDSRPEDRQLAAGVSAAGRILAHVEWSSEQAVRPRETLLQVLNGDEAAVEAWHEAELEALRAKKKGAA